METNVNETTVTVVVIAIAVLLSLLLAFSQWALYRLSGRLAELIPAEFVEGITSLLAKATDAGKVTLATRALELADETKTTLDDELIRTTISPHYNIDRTDDGKYVLTPKARHDNVTPDA